MINTLAFHWFCLACEKNVNKNLRIKSMHRDVETSLACSDAKMVDIIKTLETKNEIKLGTEEVEVIVDQIINKTTRKYDSHVNIKSIDKKYN